MKYKLSIIGSLVYCAVGVAFTSCYNEYDAPGETVKDWAGTSERFVPTDERGFTTFYTPYVIKPTDNVGGVGDPMPFYDAKNSEFKVLYLQDYATNKPYCFHPYWGLKTKDCSSYESLGEILSAGSNDFQQDAALGTGCCFYNEADGLYYIYYTGENGKCTNRQVVMRATSHDFKTWTRDNLWQLNGPEYGYNGFDFRDPQIFKGDDGKFHMVIATRPQAGGNGVFAEFVSADMKNWENAGSFPMVWDRFCECPDVFKMGDWWYLVYSESFKTSWSRKVKYMMADSWENLKKCFNDPGANWPKDGREGVLDSRAFYAGKTASNGTDRYIWGWCPYRPVEDIDARNINVGAGDGNEPKWGGALVCHKVLQHEDGTLTLTAVPSLNNKYNKPQTVREMESKGYANGKLTGEGAYVLYNRLGYHNHMSFTVKTAGNTDKFGVSLFRGSDSKKYYTMVFNPEGENDRKINMEQEGAEGKGFIEAVDSYKFQRPADNVYNIDIYTDNSVFVIYVNDNICYTMRLYGIQKNCWSINNYGGEIEVSNLKVSAY
jgi:beta-fructofuranosidase